MGIFDFGGQVLKTAIRTVTLPVSLTKDFVTMGGVLIDEEESATARHLKKLIKDIDDLPGSIDE